MVLSDDTQSSAVPPRRLLLVLGHGHLPHQARRAEAVRGVYITDEEMSPAARRLFECVFARVEKKLDVDDQVLLMAKILIRATIDRPISNAVLQGQLRASEREVKAAVRTLRREWSCPSAQAASRRAATTG